MLIVARHPVTELSAWFLPAMVFTEPGLPADPVIPNPHSAGGGLRHPQVSLGGCFRGVAPFYFSGGPGAGDVGDGAALHHRARHAPLLRAAPGRSVVAAAALVIAVEPEALFTEDFEVDRRANATAKIGEVEIVRMFFLGDRIIELPQLNAALREAARETPVSRVLPFPCRLHNSRPAILPAAASRW